MRLFLFLLWAVSSSSWASGAPVPVSFNFSGMTVSQSVNLIYSEALKTDYVISPEVVQDQRVVSFRYDSSKGELAAFVGSFLDSLGLAAVRHG